MAGKIQRKNKTNKVNKKAKHARRTRRVSRKTLNKRKQRKGGSFMSKLGWCNRNETSYDIKEDKGGKQITEGVFKSNDDSENIKIARICRVYDDDGIITFITDNKERIDMADLIKDYPNYQPPIDDKDKKISIKYYFDESDGFKLKEKPTDAIKSKFNKFKSIFGL